VLDRRIVWLWAAALLLAVAGDAHAHKMMAHGRVYDDGTVLLQGFFPDGKAARGVAVEVRRPDGSLFLEGTTDGKGKLTFTPDGPAGQWSATFTGSMGHKVTTTFQVDSPGDRPSASVAEAGPVAPEPPGDSGTPRGPAAPTSAAAQDDLRVREPFPWTRVLAGLGFIFGLSALLMGLGLRKRLRALERGDVGGPTS